MAGGWKEPLRGTLVESAYRRARDRVWRASRFYDALLAKRRREAHERWVAEGRPLPAPAEVKQELVLEYARSHALRTLVETGTHLGGTVEAARRTFDRIVSIELDPVLARGAARRFAGYRDVTILEGDSGAILPELARSLEEPAVWWLDAHYCGHGTGRGSSDTPIGAELDAILQRRAGGDVVLIDDARLFTGEGGYPTVEQLREQVAERFEVEVADDVIRLLDRVDPRR